MEQHVASRAEALLTARADGSAAMPDAVLVQSVPRAKHLEAAGLPAHEWAEARGRAAGASCRQTAQALIRNPPHAGSPAGNVIRVRKSYIGWCNSRCAGAPQRFRSIGG